MKPHPWCVGLILAAATSASASVGPPISADSHTLAPNASGQVVQLFISGSDLIAGEDLTFQINDGTYGPTITSVDILTDTIFAANNRGESAGNGPSGVLASGPYADRVAIVSTVTQTGTVLDNGLLARITLDTSGFFAGTFQLNMVSTVNGESRLISAPALAALTPTFTSNVFSVPEPASLSLLALGALLLCRRKPA